jgi:hypothetical protein
MKAIDTAYQGYKFRSRLEARWAVFFDEMGIEWEYEVEGFNLFSFRYLPDFWLPGFNCYAEVKPKMFTISEFQKCSALSKPCILLDVSHPQSRSYYVTNASENLCNYSEYEKDGYGRMIFCQSLYKGHLWFLCGESHNDYAGCGCGQAEVSAKSARFEFGEHGGKQ